MAMDLDTLYAFMQVANHLGIDIVTHGYVPPDAPDTCKGDACRCHDPGACRCACGVHVDDGAGNCAG
jgi:hypothetical protein